MEIKNNVLISVTEADIKNGKFVNKKVTEIADGCFYNLPSLRVVTLPKVTTAGSDCFSYNQALTEVNLPALTTAGSYCFRSNQALTEVNLPALTTAGSYCFSSNQALTEVNLPALTTAGSYCFSYNQALTEVNLPALTTAGSDCFRYNQALTEVNLFKAKLKVKDVDGSCFVIQNQKTSKGIKIYQGYNLSSITNNKYNKFDCFVAEKEGFYAHGETIKKAVSDVQFKIACEKLKNEPIHKDTIITVNHYRLITGACEAGVKQWMLQNNIKSETITAEELLPLLKKTSAYGVEKFKQLVQF